MKCYDWHMARSPARVSTFVEQFASDLEAAGIPRLPARVFVTLLVQDDGYLSAADLAERLQISPAAVSGAVRYLVQVNLVRREREPGSRRDRYRVSEDAWYEASVSRQAMLQQWERTLGDGVAALGPSTPAGARMQDTLEFVAFLQRELPGVLARWRRTRARRRRS
jgi:DNA-binding transcriptional regulator GbsR (MarR family)